MRVIGVTGGVGAGKSRVLDILHKEYGAAVIQTDQVARELEEPGQAGYAGLVEAFGAKILSDDGTIDRQALARRIFGDAKAREQVNRIIHPLTWKRSAEQIAAGGAALTALESAIFDDSGRALCTEIWYVDTAKENRISRVMANRGYTRPQTERMMESQPSRTEYLTMADRVIDNNGSIEEVRQQIERILLREQES